MSAGGLAWADGQPRSREEALSAWPLAREVLDFIVAAGPVMDWMVARDLGLPDRTVARAVEYLYLSDCNGFGRLIDRRPVRFGPPGSPFAVWLWSPEVLGDHPARLIRRIETCRLHIARARKERAA